MPRKTYHSQTSKVYHTDTECTSGNNIEKKNERPGTGGKRLCKHCGGTKKRR